MPNGMVWLDADTCKRVWALVPPPAEYPMVAWRSKFLHMGREQEWYLALVHGQRQDAIPAVDAVTALRALKAAGKVEWAYSDGEWVGRATTVLGSFTSAGDAEALLLAVLDAMEARS